MRNAQCFVYGLLLITVTVMNTGCALGTRIKGWEGVMASESVTVLPFKDHVSEDARDSDGTGKKCQDILAEKLSDDHSDVVKAHVPAGHDSKTVLSDADAQALGKSLKVDYVVYGDCIEYYDVAPFTFRADRAGMQVWVLRVADGVVVYTVKHAQNSDSNYDSPEGLLEEMAEGIAKGILN
jgi:hypothetical protein